MEIEGGGEGGVFSLDCHICCPLASDFGLDGWMGECTNSSLRSDHYGSLQKPLRGV